MSSIQTVKIVRFHRIGPPEVLQLDEVPLPHPAEGEVRLRVKAIGLNRAESHFRQGRYRFAPRFPSKIGYEASGIVEAVGPGVDSSWIGKRASTVPAFPADSYGVYGEVAIVPASAVAEYPAHLSYEEAASVWMQYITAYGALIREANLSAGDFVVITAASSSVGIAAIEIARLQGSTSIATTRSSSKKARLLALGADHVIATDAEDLAECVSEITGGKGARVIFDPIAGQMLLKLAAAAAPSGLILEYGIMADEPTPYPLFVALNKHLTIKAYTLFEVVSNPDTFPLEFQASKKYVFDHILKGDFKPVITRTFPLSDVVEAHRYLESNAQIGKIVLTV
jgi:NADPH:quinone reductase-like Zn-dependent oxidoreductase